MNHRIVIAGRLIVLASAVLGMLSVLTSSGQGFFSNPPIVFAIFGLIFGATVWAVGWIKGA